MVKFPNIKVKLRGADGNAFNIMGIVKVALQKNKVPKEDIDQYLKESMSGDYDNLLRVAMETVNVN